MTGPVIYVEDEPDDAFLMQRAFQEFAPEVKLKILTNGQEAIEFFQDYVPPESGFKPGLVLLDLNLPGRSGLEVLQEIRSMPRVRRLPVIMYTSSSLPVDIVEAYDRGCSAYLVKPGSFDQMRDVVGALTDFWIRKNRYPSPEEAQVNQ